MSELILGMLALNNARKDALAQCRHSTVLVWTYLSFNAMSSHVPGIGELLMDVLAALAARGTSECADGEHDSSSLLLLGPPGVGAQHPCMGTILYQLSKD